MVQSGWPIFGDVCRDLCRRISSYKKTGDPLRYAGDPVSVAIIADSDGNQGIFVPGKGEKASGRQRRSRGPV